MTPACGPIYDHHHSQGGDQSPLGGWFGNGGTGTSSAGRYSYDDDGGELTGKGDESCRKRILGGKDGGAGERRAVSLDALEMELEGLGSGNQGFV